MIDVSSDPLSYSEFSDLFHTFMTEDPNKRASLGVHRDLGRLPDPSLDFVAREAVGARELLGRIPDTESASAKSEFDEHMDLELADLLLRACVERSTRSINGRPEIAQKPTAGDDVGDGIFAIFAQDQRPAAERLEDMLGRIKAVPSYLEGLLHRLDTPIKRWVDIDLEKVEELPSLFESVIGLAREEAFAGLGDLRTSVSIANQALVNYATELRRMKTHTRLHVGREAAEDIVFFRGIDLALEQIYAGAVDFFRDSRREIEELRRRLVRRYERDPSTPADVLLSFLKERFAVKVKHPRDYESVLARYEMERERVLAWIEESGLFPIPEHHEMKIILTPNFMKPSIPAGAMLPAQPFAPWNPVSIIFLTLAPELLPEHTELGIPNMMVHEGIPGHHLDFSWHAWHPSVIRRHSVSEHGSEGWTTMLERYMLQRGYGGELHDEIHFCNLFELQRMGARVAIDLFFMTGERGFLDVGVDFDRNSEDPFVLAGNLLASATNFQSGRVQAELNWYSQERGYPLSYLTGNRMMWALRDDVEKANRAKLEGERLSSDALAYHFHDSFLQSGSIPLPFFRRTLQYQGLL